MYIKEEKGYTGVDIAISIVIITIFISLVGNLIININTNSKNMERKTVATSYAVQEIEKIKSQGYIDNYENKGIDKQDIIEESDILDEEGNFTGYSKKILIKDYIFIQDDNTKQSNLVKELTVQILYNSGNKEQSVKISTYITKE